MDSIVKALLESIESQLDVLKVQCLAIRQRVDSLDAATMPRVELALPERCHAHPGHRCGLQDDSARIALGTLSQPGKWQCRGCREIHIDGIGELADS